MKKLTKLAVALAAPFALTLATSAHADLVTQWGFQLDSGFSSFAPGAVVGSNYNGFYGTPTTLTWGTGGSGPSSLDVSGGTNGTSIGSFDTDGPAAPITTLIHNNNPVTGTSLTSAMLNTQLMLTPTAPLPVGPSLPPLFMDFDILFEETPNDGTCTVGSVSNCDDIFVVSVENALFDPVTGSLFQNFDYGDETYDLVLSIDGLGALTDEQCTTAGALAGCYGFTTLENASNSFDVALSISTDIFEVPEPSAIALLSLGLIGLGGLGRKKAAK